MVAYELWEMRTGNLMASYDSEDRALAIVSETAHVHGADSVMSFALVREDGRGRSRTIATGQELLARAQSRAPSPEDTGFDGGSANSDGMVTSGGGAGAARERV